MSQRKKQYVLERTRWLRNLRIEMREKKSSMKFDVKQNVKENSYQIRDSKVTTSESILQKKKSSVIRINSPKKNKRENETRTKFCNGKTRI